MTTRPPMGRTACSSPGLPDDNELIIVEVP
jgi:hypothetical protein